MKWLMALLLTSDLAIAACGRSGCSGRINKIDVACTLFLVVVVYFVYKAVEENA